MYCGDFSTNSAYERMKSTSDTKGYKTTYSKQTNSNSKSNSSGFKVITGIATVGLITYMIWKNIIKPASDVVSKFAGLFNEETKSDNVMREDDRILPGTCRPISKSELRVLNRKYRPIERDVKYVIYDD